MQRQVSPLSPHEADLLARLHPDRVAHLARLSGVVSAPLT
jgi:hypothetical protein